MIIIKSVPTKQSGTVDAGNTATDNTQQGLGVLSKEERNEFAIKNEKLIYFTANQFKTSRVSYDELISIATLGFAKALNKYDRDKGVKFSTYSIRCMRNEILYFLRKERKHLDNNLSFNKILATDKNGNDLSLENTIGDFKVDIEEKAIQDEYAVMLRKAILELKKNEQYVAVYRFGLDRGIIKTQTEIADEMQMSQANISKIEATIKDKLKDILTKKYKISYQVH